MSRPEDRDRTVRIRRAPKFSVFVILGGLIGLIVSLILTASFPIDPTVGFGPTFGYFAIYGVVAGVLVGSLVALLLDRILSRGGKTVEATVDRLQVPDFESRATDPVATDPVATDPVEPESVETASESADADPDRV